MFKIVYFTAVETYLSILNKAYKEVKDRDMEVKVFTRRNLTTKLEQDELKEHLKDADVFIIQLMGDEHSFPNSEYYLNSISENTKVYIHSTTLSGNEFAKKFSNIEVKVTKKIFQYITSSGKVNFINLFKYLNYSFGNGELDFHEPMELPWEGIYHPTHGNCLNIDEYLEKVYDPDKITVGLSFYRNHWLNEDLHFINTFINSIEDAGMNALPVFVSAYKNSEIKNLGLSNVYKKFFMKEDKLLIDILINTTFFSNSKIGEDQQTYLNTLDVPILQVLLNSETREQWEKEIYGLNPVSISINIAMPEFDGVIISVPAAFKELKQDTDSLINFVEYTPDEERINKIVRMAKSYGILRKLRNKDKKVAIILHNYPAKNENIGCAYGLDTQQSVINILKELKREGYYVEHIYESSKELMNKIFERATCHEDWNNEIKIRRSYSLHQKEYENSFLSLDKSLQNKMVEEWGIPLGQNMVSEENLIIPGIINGNIFIGIQPTRGFAFDSSKIYHSPDITMPHHYYGYYQWIKNVFGANAVIHMGKHGSLEWLPGKAVGLSNTCQSDAVIDDLPNIYPYIINNPGEGTQAKRRSFACIISHLEPAMERADTYDNLAELEGKIEEYNESKNYQMEKALLIEGEIEELIIKTALDKDLDVESNSFEEKLEKIHGYLHEIKDTLINNGLHTLGEYPMGEELTKFVIALTRLSNGEVPSLREEIIKSMGYTLDECYEFRGSVHFGLKTGGQIIDEADTIGIKIINSVLEGNEIEDIDQLVASYCKDNKENIMVVINYIIDQLLPNIEKTTDEIDHIIKALDGRFVSPGGSGAPTRGQADILPTGRNFYTVNPFAIPNKSAWETGKKLGDDLLKRYVSENESYPENIGIVLWGSPTMRTKGDDISEIMYLMGVKPIWQKGTTTIRGWEIIPLEELKRPRIDVTVRVSGFFRDAFANIMEYLDGIVQELAFLDEPHDMNYIAKHVAEDMEDLKSKGISSKEAKEKSLYRIFSAKPGAYGTGVNTLIDEKNWESQEDLAKVYLEWGSYAYGKNNHGKQSKDMFQKRLSRLDVAVKNMDTKETDIFANDDNYAYLGGMLSAIKVFRGKAVEGMIGDSSDPSRTKVRSLSEEVKFVLRSKVLNPKWIKGLQNHGFKGGTDISRSIDYIFGWSGTTNVIDDWDYEQLTEKFIFDKDFSDWIQENNPYARQNIIERMLEAIQRGLWNADEETKEKIIKEYLANEGLLEGAEYIDK